MAQLVTLQFRVLVKTDDVPALKKSLEIRGKFALRAIHNCLKMGDIEIIGPNKDEQSIHRTRIAVREVSDATVILL